MTKYRDFFEACCDGNVAIVEDLLSRRMLLFFAAIDVNELVKINELSNDEVVGYSGIELAAERGHLDIVRLLVENSAAVHTTSALQLAAAKGHIDVLNLLAKTIANAEDKESELKSAFVAAFYRGSATSLNISCRKKDLRNGASDRPTTQHLGIEPRQADGPSS